MMPQIEQSYTYFLNYFFAARSAHDPQAAQHEAPAASTTVHNFGQPIDTKRPREGA
jgi:hypothetical protein